MIFTKLVEDLSPYELCKWRSKDGKWTMGVRQMMFGRRVFCEQVGNDFYTLDYCTGDDLVITTIIVLLVMRSLHSVDESVAPKELKKLFPVEKARPIIPRDLPCFHGLMNMASSAPADLVLPDLIELQSLLSEGVDRARRTFENQMNPNCS